MIISVGYSNKKVLIVELMHVTLLLETFYTRKWGNSNPSDNEYYANLLISTSTLGISDWNEILGLGYYDPILKKRVSTFDNSINLSAWNAIGGDNGFTLKCD